MIYLPRSGRVVVTGGPRTGKTYLAKSRLSDGFRVRHTDVLAETHEWSAASEEASRWMSEPASWLIEGTAAVRALRKWMAANPDGKPCDVVVWLDRPKADRSKGQESMAKGCDTIWAGVWPELMRRGVEIQLQE